jgi:hypothetical protein
MPEQVAEFQGYFIRYPDNPSEERKKIPLELRESLTEILENFVQKITQYPERIKPYDQHPGQLRYCQPEPALEIAYRVDHENKVIQFVSYYAPVQDKKKLIFISYCQNDQEWLEELKKSLVPLERRNIIKIWDPTQIRPGDVIRNEINESLNSAKAAVLLVTRDYLSTTEIMEDTLPPLLAAAEAGKLKILWIQVSFCDVDSYPEIVKYKPLNDRDQPLKNLNESERDRVLTDIGEKIKKVVGE